MGLANVEGRARVILGGVCTVVAYAVFPAPKRVLPVVLERHAVSDMRANGRGSTGSWNKTRALGIPVLGATAEWPTVYQTIYGTAVGH